MELKVAAELSETVVVGEGSLDEPACYHVGNGSVLLYTEGAPERRPENDDAVAVIPFGDSAVLAVADGLGGQRAGSKASALALRTLAEVLERASRGGGSAREAVLDGIEAANRAIRDLGIGAATTLALVEIGGGRARPYHIGDSAILIVGGRGKVKFQSISHSPVGYAVESGILGEEEAIFHEQRHIVSNVLGTSEMRIEIGPSITLRPRDTVCLASDGLTDNLRPDEILAGVHRGSLEQVGASLVELARTRMSSGRSATTPGKPDDLSLILYRPR